MTLIYFCMPEIFKTKFSTQFLSIKSSFEFVLSCCEFTKVILFVLKLSGVEAFVIDCWCIKYLKSLLNLCFGIYAKICNKVWSHLLIWILISPWNFLWVHLSYNIHCINGHNCKYWPQFHFSLKKYLICQKIKIPKLYKLFLMLGRWNVW